MWIEIKEHGCDSKGYFTFLFKTTSVSNACHVSSKLIKLSFFHALHCLSSSNITGSNTLENLSQYLCMVLANADLLMAWNAPVYHLEMRGNSHVLHNIEGCVNLRVLGCAIKSAYISSKEPRSRRIVGNTHLAECDGGANGLTLPVAGIGKI